MCSNMHNPAEWEEHGESNGKVKADKEKKKENIWEFIFFHALPLWKRGWGFSGF